MSDMNTNTSMTAYDPATHENQIVAIYENRASANAARSALLGAGVSASAIEIIEGETDPATREGVSQEVREEGFWGAMKNLFAPDEDVHAYSHAVSQGHPMLMVTPDSSMDRQRIIEVLESTSPIDFDAKVDQWRNEGYQYTPSTTTGATAAAASAGAMAAAPMTTGARTATPMASGPMTTGTATAATGAAALGTNETVQVMEERLRVGKREVAGGGVRVRSYIVERPVEEQVRLRDERVSIERRPVDRPATAEDIALFKEHTIEARATSEEAVVSKEARVVEEIGIRKEAGERTETVHDTVRKTEVEVEDQSTTAGRVSGTMGTGGTVTNATPGAGSSGTNSPRPTTK